MYQELIERLTEFAKERDFVFNYGYEEFSGKYYFSFDDPETMFGYHTVFSPEQLDTYNGPIADVAEYIISMVLKKFKYKDVIWKPWKWRTKNAD